MGLMPSPSIWNSSVSDPTLTGRVTTLEGKYVRTSRFVSISTTTGTVTLPPNSTVVLNDFGAAGVSAVVAGISGGRPTYSSVYTAGGAVISATFNGAGNYTLSGVPASGYPVALVYRVQQTLVNLDSTATDIEGSPQVVNFATWGSISGSITNQADLIAAFAGYQPLLPTFTDGSVIFAAGGTIAEDNDHFFWDGENLRVGTNPHVGGVLTVFNDNDSRANIVLPASATQTKNLFTMYDGEELLQTAFGPSGAAFFGLNDVTPDFLSPLTVAGAIGVRDPGYPTVELSYIKSYRNSNISFGTGNFGAGAPSSGPNVAIGSSALAAVTGGRSNYAIGASALAVLTTGAGNIAIGEGAGGNTVETGSCIYIGAASGGNVNAGANIAIGNAALLGGSPGVSTASANIAMGTSALSNLASGDSNIAIGISAGAGLSGGVSNLFIGQNIKDFYGSSVNGNVILGPLAGRYCKDNYNTAIGYQAAQGNEGSENVAIGKQALYGPIASQGLGTITGTKNIAVGAFSLQAVTTGSKNIGIGYNVDVPSATASGQLSIGNFIYGTGLTGETTTVSSGKIGFGTKTPSGIVEVNGGAGLTPTDALSLALVNSTVAISGSQMPSPALRMTGNGFKTNATAASQPVGLANYLLPVQGAAAPTSVLNWDFNINSGSYATKMSLTNTGDLTLLGKITLPATNTAAGTTGAQTINKPSGTVNFAAAATSLVVTNSYVTTSSIVMCVIRTNDTTAVIKNVVPGSGSFTITLNSAATAETSVGFMVIN